MGRLFCGDGATLDTDDRVLAHMQVVMLAKLRRSEAFAFSWQHRRDEGSGRTTIWVHPCLNLRFEYSGGRPPELNRAWLEELTALANSSGGLRLLPEPENASPFPLRDKASAVPAPM